MAEGLFYKTMKQKNRGEVSLRWPLPRSGVDFLDLQTIEVTTVIYTAQRGLSGDPGLHGVAAFCLQLHTIGQTPKYGRRYLRAEFPGFFVWWMRQPPLAQVIPSDPSSMGAGMRLWNQFKSFHFDAGFSYSEVTETRVSRFIES
jgi:hypothetical protein